MKRNFEFFESLCLKSSPFKGLYQSMAQPSSIFSVESSHQNRLDAKKDYYYYLVFNESE